MGNRKKIRYIVWKMDYWVSRYCPQDFMDVFMWIEINHVQLKSYYPKFTYN